MADFSDFDLSLGSNVSEEVRNAEADARVKSLLIKDIEGVANRLSLMQVLDTVQDRLPDQLNRLRSTAVTFAIPKVTADSQRIYLRGLLDLQKQYYPEDYDSKYEELFSPEQGRLF